MEDLVNGMTTHDKLLFEYSNTSCMQVASIFHGGEKQQTAHIV